MTCNMRFVFLFKQKTAYEMRISDWSSDVCSSDLAAVVGQRGQAGKIRRLKRLQFGIGDEAGAGFFRLRQTEFRRRYGLYAKGAEKLARKSVVEGQSVSVSVDLGGHLIVKKNNYQNHNIHIHHHKQKSNHTRT